MKPIFSILGRPATLLSVLAVVTLKINKCLYVSINTLRTLTFVCQRFDNCQNCQKGLR